MLLGAAWGSDANAVTIGFDDLATGEIVDSQYLASHGVTISGVSLVPGGADLAITFDSGATGTADPDLEGLPWSGGNLATLGAELEKILILPENTIDGDGDGLIDDPDDQGRRPAGFFSFAFETPIVEFGLDLIDIEPPSEFGKLSFFSEGALVGTIAFEDLPSLVGDPDFVFGDNTANRVQPIDASYFGADNFDLVIVNMGGSGAVDNITFSVAPEPGTLLLIGLGLTGVAASRRGAVRRVRPRRP
jgi:hypothetical protein